MVSVSIAIMVTCARSFFALGRDGLLPAWTAKTSPYDTPLAGNLIVAVWSVLLIVWANLASYGKASPLPSVLQSFFITTAVGSYLIELIYLFLAVVAFYILWTDGRRSLRDAWAYIVVLAGLATPVLAFKGSLSPFPTYPNNLGVYAAAVRVVIAAVWTAGVRMMRPERVQQAGIYALEDAEAAPYGVGDGMVVYEPQEQTHPASDF